MNGNIKIQEIDFTHLLPQRTLTSAKNDIIFRGGRLRQRRRIYITPILSGALALLGATSLTLFTLTGLSSLYTHGLSSVISPAFTVDLPVKSQAEIPKNEIITEDVPVTDAEEERNNQITDIYAFDASAVPDDEYPIVPTDMSTVFATTEPYISNATSLSPDISSLYFESYPLPPADELAKEGEPIVLIIHTHGTEAYSDEDSISYSNSNSAPRSSDTEKNVVSVGKVMSNILTERGVSNIHCTIMHDKESYKDSYSRAAETIKEYLKKYPSIKYVFDVHRDSIVKSNGEKVRPIFEHNGEKVAQVMSVVGTNELGANFPDWEKNLNIALKLHSLMEEKYGNASRPINLRGAAFNEHFSEAALLLEVGSCGNTLSEAKAAGVLLADTLADLILRGNGE